MQALRRLRLITLNDSKALLFDSTITSAASPVLMASYLHKTPDISRTFAAYRTYTPSEFKLYSLARVAFCILQRRMRWRLPLLIGHRQLAARPAGIPDEEPKQALLPASC